MADKLTGGTMSQVPARDRVLRISATDIVGGGGNDRLSAQDGDVYLRPGEHVCLVTLATASGSIDVFLPDAMSVVGESYVVKAVSIANSKTITVKDRAGNDAVGDALSVTADIVVIMSIGDGWTVLVDVTT